MRRKAFLWSASTLYMGIILLLLSSQNGEMIVLLSDVASNRIASDKLQLAAYNTLLDLNRYLYRTTTDRIYLIAQEGRPPEGLESTIRTEDWTGRMAASLRQDGIDAGIVITSLEITRHQSPRDLVQMSSLSLPAAHSLFEGAADINCDLSVTLKQSRPYAGAHFDFKIRTLSPARIYGLLQQAETFCNLVQNQMRGWPEGGQPQIVADRVASKFERLAQQLCKNATRESYSVKVRFKVDVTRSSAHSFEIQLRLEGGITDLSQFSYAVVDSEYKRISLSIDRTFSFVYSPPVDSGGPDRASVERTIQSSL